MGVSLHQWLQLFACGGSRTNCLINPQPPPRHPPSPLAPLASSRLALCLLWHLVRLFAILPVIHASSIAGARVIIPRRAIPPFFDVHGRSVS